VGLVIDVSHEEKAKLVALLEGLAAQSRIFFGFYESQAIVMTCHFQSARGQRHVHFIDGEGGGLTLAALDLKLKRGEIKKAR
jgi:hypothetical protein